MLFVKKKACSYQICNKKPQFKEQTIQRPERKGQTICYKTLLRKTKDWTTQTTLNTQVLWYSSCSCSTSDTHCATLVTNPC